ncbi:hypothetical protein O181_042987 [Austropuccinia psidii MF-1]|uniref:Uncharacterized protein n=1 Tax=Austropuccinia psidii MF-1 TaxID=1389203 RepID=A0A9Q3DJN9_9BASI|nr:hypothetical protein [Austropuccinia psidii MF-1]
MLIRSPGIKLHAILFLLWQISFSKGFNRYIKITEEGSNSEAEATVDIYQLPPITAFDPPKDPNSRKNAERQNYDYANFLIKMAHNNAQTSKKTCGTCRKNQSRCPSNRNLSVLFKTRFGWLWPINNSVSTCQDPTFENSELEWFSQLWNQKQLDHRKGLFYIHSAFRYLLDSEEVLPQEVAEWIDMFARIMRINEKESSALALEALMRCGLYSLLVKFGGFEGEISVLSDYIRALIDHLENRLVPVFFSGKKPVWISGDYKTFVEQTSYDSQFSPFYDLVKVKDPRQIQLKLEKLLEMSRKSSRGVSATSKSAAIVFLYHLAQQGENKTLHVQARSTILSLSQKKNTSLFLHDRKLLDWIVKRTGMENDNKKDKSALAIR